MNSIFHVVEMVSVVAIFFQLRVQAMVTSFLA